MRKLYYLILLALLPQFVGAYTQQRVSVHDPSIVWEPTSQTYYVFGSHQAWAKSTDLMNWATVPFAWKKADGTAATYANAFNTNATTTVKIGGATVNFGNFDAAAWCSALAKNHKNEPWGTLEGNLWAPDVIYNRAMNKWCMYLSLNGVEFNSVIILLTADKIEGPYVYQGPVVFGGFNMTNAETATDYKKSDLELVIGEQASLPERYAKGLNWGSFWPNCIDPCVFYDEEGNLWMTYGSWFGGIWMLQLDEETGLRDYNVSDAYGSDFNRGVNVSKDPYFGIKIAGGRGVSGEASYVKYIDGYYYLFVTYGGLKAKGGYQMRVFRSDSPTGPYKDSYSDLGPSYPSHAIYTGSGDSPNYGPDGTRKTDRGENIFGAYGNWGYMATGDDSERSQGHNSVITNGDQTFMVYHTRFQNRAIEEAHELRVHQVFKNSDGWLCAAPFEYTGETVTNTQIKTTQQIATADIPGNYKMMLHTLNLDHANKQLTTPVNIELMSDGSITGDMTGTWSITEGTSYISITVGEKTYNGVMIEQTMEPTTQKVPAFSAMAKSNGNTIWGYKAETIGTTSTGWTTAYTTPIKLSTNKMVTYSFTVDALGTGTFDGPIVDLSKTNSPNENNVNAHLFLRMSDWAFHIGTKDWWTGAITYGNTLGTTATKDVIVGASVVVTVRRTGTKAIVQTDITKSGTTYHHYYAQDLETTDDIYVMLAGDNTQFTLTDTSIDTYQVNGTLVGDEVNNTGFTVDATKYKLVPNGTLKLHFTNYTNKLILYNNWGVEMVTGGKYFNLVAGGNIWGELNVAGTAENVDWPTDAVLSDKLDGADVQLTIVRDEGKVTVKAVHTTKDGETFTRGYSFTPSLADFASATLDVSLSTEGAHLDLLSAEVGTTISAYDWSTFVCGDYALDFSQAPDGLTAYAVTGHDGANINKVEVASAVPAGTPLLLQGDANTTYFIPVAASGTAPAVNLLKAGTGESVEPESGKTKYALSVEAGAAHFKKIEADRAIPVGKAYLEYSETIAARELGFDGEATGIKGLTPNPSPIGEGSDRVYDLNGRCIGQWSMVNGQLKPGLYIVNGKKVVIK